MPNPTITGGQPASRGSQRRRAFKFVAGAGALWLLIELGLAIGLVVYLAS